MADQPPASSDAPRVERFLHNGAAYRAEVFPTSPGVVGVFDEATQTTRCVFAFLSGDPEAEWTGERDDTLLAAAMAALEEADR